MCKISVILTTYNGEKFIDETIKSILQQTYKDFQFIIVDDGSIDNTAKIIKKYSDKRIKSYFQEHSGHVKALNFALSKCTTELTSIIDHDDIAENTKLEKQYNVFVSDKTVGVVGSSYKVINQQGNKLYIQFLPTENKEIKKKLIYRDVICHSGVMYRTNLVKERGCYREKFSVAADFDLWLNLYNYTKFYNINIPLISFRKHSSSQTSSLNKYTLNNEITLEVLKDHINLVKENEQYIKAFWEILYGNISYGRKLLLKEVCSFSKISKEKLKFLFMSIFTRKCLNLYFYYQPLRKILTK